MEIIFASYNIHKAVGSDFRRDPARILQVIGEIGADIIALQEVDRRFGRRLSVLDLDMIESCSPYTIVPVATQHRALGWHGNAMLIRKGIQVDAIRRISLPAMEPRGALCVDLVMGALPLRVVGMHLDLSGLRRRRQLRTVLHHLRDAERELPSVLMGDFNEWARHGGALREFGCDGVIDGGQAPDRQTLKKPALVKQKGGGCPWQVLMPGRSFPARRPLGTLDRIVASHEWQLIATGVHRSVLASQASDHLPVTARLRLR